MINKSSQLAGQKMAMVLLCICRVDSTESTKQSLMRDVGQCCKEALLLLKALWMLWQSFMLAQVILKLFVLSLMICAKFLKLFVLLKFCFSCLCVVEVLGVV